MTEEVVSQELYGLVHEEARMYIVGTRFELAVFAPRDGVVTVDLVEHTEHGPTLIRSEDHSLQSIKAHLLAGLLNRSCSPKIAEDLLRGKLEFSE